MFLKCLMCFFEGGRKSLKLFIHSSFRAHFRVTFAMDGTVYMKTTATWSTLPAKTMGIRNCLWHVEPASDFDYVQTSCLKLANTTGGIYERNLGCRGI